MSGWVVVFLNTCFSWRCRRSRGRWWTRSASTPTTPRTGRWTGTSSRTSSSSPNRQRIDAAVATSQLSVIAKFGRLPALKFAKIVRELYLELPNLLNGKKKPYLFSHSRTLALLRRYFLLSSPSPSPSPLSSPSPSDQHHSGR